MGTIKFAMTREEHAKATLEAIEEAHKRNMQSKEAALKFLRAAGIIQDDTTEPKVKSTRKKSK